MRDDPVLNSALWALDLPEGGWIKVVCNECNPPSILDVPASWDVDRENYICTVCIARVLKRIERAEMYRQNPGRMSHGQARDEGSQL